VVLLSLSRRDVAASFHVELSDFRNAAIRAFNTDAAVTVARKDRAVAEGPHRLGSRRLFAER